jgi:hypothetical protein
MKNIISYALGVFLLATSAQAAPFFAAQAASRMMPKSGSAAADRKAVNIARVKLMNDARKLGPDAPQVEQDKKALVSALEKLQGDSSTGGNRPVNVKRNPKKAAARKAKKNNRTMAAKTRAPRKAKHRKVSHLRTRKHARTV